MTDGEPLQNADDHSADAPATDPAGWWPVASESELLRLLPGDRVRAIGGGGDGEAVADHLVTGHPHRAAGVGDWVVPVEGTVLPLEWVFATKLAALQPAADPCVVVG